MKKQLFLLILTTISLNAFGQLCMDQKTKKFYCLNPRYTIDQREYDKLVRKFAEMAKKNEPDIALFGFLRVVGTPTALQLIEDIKEMVQLALYDTYSQYRA